MTRINLKRPKMGRIALRSGFEFARISNDVPELDGGDLEEVRHIVSPLMRRPPHLAEEGGEDAI